MTTAFDFNAAFETTAAAHFRALGAETVTLSRARDLVDSTNKQITQVRLLTNASIGATSISIAPLAGTAKGFLPEGLALAAGVVLSAEVKISNQSASFAVPVVALAAALTAPLTWTVPAAATWQVADVLPFEPKVANFSFGQGSAVGDIDRGFQAPKLGFPVTSLAAAGAPTPRTGDVVIWSRGQSKILGRPIRLGDSVDVELEVPS